MRFKFCGDIDPPEWLLSEVGLISRISAVRLKVITQHLARRLAGEAWDAQRIEKLAKDSGLSDLEILSLQATICFILSTAVKFNAGDEVLSNELQQLGLPSENADALTRCLRDGRVAIGGYQRTNFLTFPRIRSLQWRYDYDLLKKQPEIEVQLTHDAGNCQFALSQSQLEVLLHELVRAKGMMAGLGSD